MIKGFLEEIKKQEESKNLYKTNRNQHNNFKLFYSTGFNKKDEEKANNLTKNYIKFSELYKTSFKNKRRTNNFSVSTKLIDSNMRRRIMFIDSNYPITLRDEELGKSLETQIFFKKIHKRVLIIEELDNEDSMMKFLPKKYSNIFEEIFKFEDKTQYFKIIDLYNDCINNYQYSSIDSKSTFYILKKYGTENIFLYLKSLIVKISKNGNVFYEFALPLNIIPFFYSINSKEFVFFITKLMKITNDKIEFEKDSLETLIKEISKNNVLFNKDSSFYDNNLKHIRYPLIFNNEVYDFEILLPHIELVKEGSIKIVKNTGKGLMNNLYLNNFDNWGNICLCYLSSFKNFRNMVNLIYRNDNNKDKKFEIIYIDHLIECNSTYTNQYLNNAGTKKNIYFLCQYLNEENNRIIFFRLYFYRIEISCKGKDYKYELTYNDMKKLYKLQKKYNLNDIINKCIVTNYNNDKLIFSLEFIKEYNINDNFFHPENNRKTSIYIKKPRMHWNDLIDNFESKEIITETFELTDNLIEELNNSLTDFPLIFSQTFNNIFPEIEQTSKHKRSKLRTMKTVKIKKMKENSSTHLRKNLKVLTRKPTLINKAKTINIDDEL